MSCGMIDTAKLACISFTRHYDETLHGVERGQRKIRQPVAIQRHKIVQGAPPGTSILGWHGLVYTTLKDGGATSAVAFP